MARRDKDVLRPSTRALIEHLATEVSRNTEALGTIGPALIGLANAQERDWAGIVGQLNRNTQVLKDFAVVMGRVIRILDSLPNQKEGLN